MIDLPSLCIRNANIVKNSGMACNTVIKLSRGSIGTRALNQKLQCQLQMVTKGFPLILLETHRFHDLELDLDFVMYTPRIRGSIALCPTVHGSLLCRRSIICCSLHRMQDT